MKSPRLPASVGKQPLRIIADTNILVRAAVADDPDQSRLAAEVLRSAEIVAVTVPTLCEFVWVLARDADKKPGRSHQQSGAWSIVRASGWIAQPSTRALPCSRRAGISQTADGVIAFEGRRLGGLIFTSFNRRAIEMVAATGGETRLMSAE